MNMIKLLALVPAAMALQRQPMSMSAAPPKRLCVLGGSGYQCINQLSRRVFAYG